jgi:hypothetical protein
VAVQPDFPDGEDAAPPAGGAAAGAPAAVRAMSPWRRGLLLAALALGLCGLAASAAGVVSQVLPRHFTAVQARKIMAWEVARRWRVRQAGEIFPAAVPYQLPAAAVNSGSSLGLTARRVGIAPQTACRAATDRAAGRVLARFGCKTVLRATYVDSTGSMLVTVGVAQLPSNSAARSAAGDILRAPGPARGAGLAPGVRTVAYGGTLASAFHARQRQMTQSEPDGPYLILWAAGFSDGRPRVPVSSDAYTEDEMSSFANGVADAVGDPLSATPSVPHCPGAPGC